MYAHCSWTLPVLFKPLMCIFLHIFTFEKRAHILECSYAFVAHEVRWWQRYGHVARNSLSQNNCQFHFCRNLSYRDMHMAGGPLVVHAFFPLIWVSCPELFLHLNFDDYHEKKGCGCGWSTSPKRRNPLIIRVLMMTLHLWRVCLKYVSLMY